MDPRQGNYCEGEDEMRERERLAESARERVVADVQPVVPIGSRSPVLPPQLPVALPLHPFNEQIGILACIVPTCAVFNSVTGSVYFCNGSALLFMFKAI